VVTKMVKRGKCEGRGAGLDNECAARKLAVEAGRRLAGAVQSVCQNRCTIGTVDYSGLASDG
jgi:hypothetical protein